MNTESTVKGLVFNIQKFSVNDGPGIRTVVFLKGCPLRCKWCANPESQSHRIQIAWDEKKCVRCQTCVRSCPEKAVRPASLPGRSAPSILIDHNACTGCGICVKNCPAHALSTEGEWKSVEEVLTVCLQDLPFYEESGGGVTLSGGEALSSPEFSIALTEALHENNIHVAIETTGFAAKEIFERVVRHADLLLFDMKHWDEKKHIEATGVSNLPILENMKLAVKMGKEILPRIPVIPGVNDSLEDAKGLAACLKECGLKKAQLLPFHQFGENKYHMLHQEYEYADVPALHREELEEYRGVFLENDIEAFF